jgi:hypothetical protein
MEHWMLFAPAHAVLVLGPGAQWSWTRSDRAAGDAREQDEAMLSFYCIEFEVIDGS